MVSLKERERIVLCFTKERDGRLLSFKEQKNRNKQIFKNKNVLFLLSAT